MKGWAPNGSPPRETRRRRLRKRCRSVRDVPRPHPPCSRRDRSGERPESETIESVAWSRFYPPPTGSTRGLTPNPAGLLVLEQHHHGRFDPIALEPAPDLGLPA